MPFKQVTEQDLKGKGVIGQPAVPGLSVTEMQKSVEQVVREAAIPAHNQLCEQLEAEAAAADIGAAVPGQGDMPPETPKKLQSVLEAMLAWAKEKLGLKADKADTYTKQETEEKISEGISETGFEEAVQEAKQSAQEAKEYAESINPAQFAQAEEGVTTVNASKAQNTFDIELPNSNQFVIIPDAAYASGDTFKIAAQPVAAKLPNGDSLPDGFFEAGAKVLCLLKDNVLYFTGGGNAPGNVMRYRLDDGTPGQQPEQTIWGQTSDGQDAYVHSCTKAVYNPETGKTIDEEMVTMQDSPAAITGEMPIKPVCDASGNVICPQTRTDAVYDPVSGQTLDAVIKNANLLWTNPNPTSAFVSQTIQIPESSVLLIAFLPTNDTSHALNEICIVKEVNFRMLGFAYNGFLGSRSVTYTEQGVVFGAAGNTSGQSDDTKAIPYYIYRIK